MAPLFIFLLMILVGIAITWVFELVLKNNKKLRTRYYRHHEILFGYHVHHSMYGVFLIILSIVFLLQHNISAAIISIGLALGIIIMHTISDGKFVFIEKQRY